MVEGFAEHDRARLIEVGTRLGVSDPEALIETYLAAVERWRPVTAELGTDVEAWTQRLWDEVFAQVDPSSL